jgi:hypothetical protein
MINLLRCRFLVLLALASTACVGTGVDQGDSNNDGDELPPTDDDPADDPADDPTTPECEAAYECSDQCGEQMACADTDDACWEGCDAQCNVEQACAGEEPPPDGGDPAACDAAWECSDECGAQMSCADDDDACWEQCDAQCNLEQACEGVEDPTDPGEEPPTCDEAWECSDACGEQNQCEDDACWEECDAQCQLEEACAGEGGY